MEYYWKVLGKSIVKNIALSSRKLPLFLSYKMQEEEKKATEEDPKENPSEFPISETENLSPQEYGAIEEKKLSLRRILVVGVVIFLAAFYFVWVTFLNFGTLKIEGNVPFTVTVFEEKTVECTVNPCEIKLIRGDKSVGFFRVGYSAENINTTVSLWDTVTIRPFFSLTPYMTEVKEMPKDTVSTKLVDYKLVYDTEHNNWGLYLSSTLENSLSAAETLSPALSYFAGKIESPAIFGSDASVLIFQRDASLTTNPVFYIDTVTKERFKTGEVDFTPLRVAPSPDGYFYLVEGQTSTGQKNIYIAGKYGIPQIKSFALFDNSFWSLKNKAIIVYQSEQSWIFSEIEPKTIDERLLVKTDILAPESPPQNIIVNPQTNSIFFKSGAKIYEIIY